jgi:hypothetical protein
MKYLKKLSRHFEYPINLFEVISGAIICLLSLLLIIMILSTII